jgi:hypothetical protein
MKFRGTRDANKKHYEDVDYHYIRNNVVRERCPRQCDHVCPVAFSQVSRFIGHLSWTWMQPSACACGSIHGLEKS